MITPHGPITVGEIADDSITNAKINSAAAIEGSKLADDSIVDAKINSAAAIKGSKLDPDMTNGVIGIAAGYKIARGQKTTVTSADDVDTSLSSVVAAVANMDDDPELNAAWATAVVSATAGHITIKTWKPTSNTDPTPIAATVYDKKVNWIAIGT